MAENKTRPRNASAVSFLAGVKHAQRRKDGEELLAMMEKATGEPPVMWGPSIIGFGKYHYVYESGREGDIMIAGFSPRASSQVLYLAHKDESLMSKLGKYKMGKGCLYINALDDIDRAVLRKLITTSVREVRKRIAAGAMDPRDG
jgi:hypothetical protein